jgi:hypothetical protein
MNRAAVIIFVLWVLSLTSIFPREASGTSNFYDNPELKLDLPIFDLPYQIDAANIPGYNFFDSYTHPSMDLSLNITAGVYSAFHYGMNKFKDAVGGTDKHWKRLVYYGGTAVGDFLFYFFPVPTGYFWMHESFHSAGMTHMGLRSHINFAFPDGAYAWADSGGDIYKYDLPRMIEAGIESEYLVVEKMQKNNFFYDQGMFNEFFYWLANLQAWSYAYMPFLNDELTMMVEGKEQKVSADSLQWVYYLFHPADEYIADSENNEVIGMSDLKDNEKEFLKNRVLWSLVNFASPMMFGIRSIPLVAGFSGNFALRQFYTSFGTDLSVNVYLKKAPLNMAFAYHSYVNYEHYFPAVEAALVDFPLRLGSLDIYLSPRVLIGVQPKDQDFFTADPEFFGLAGVRADFALSRHFLPYIEFTAKTGGWAAGNEFLEAAASVRLGISARF